MSPFKIHVLPKLGKKPIEDIDRHMINDVLDPIWHTKPEAATKALARLNLTLKHGAAIGLDVDLQAAAKARALMGKQRREVRHIPSMPYQETPAYYQALGDENNVRDWP